MDTYCTNCGEPWDMSCLHEPKDYGLTLRRHTIVGCAACKWHEKRGFPLRRTADIAAIAHELMGDDIDGVASAMDMAEDMGLL